MNDIDELIEWWNELQPTTKELYGNRPTQLIDTLIAEREEKQQSDPWEPEGGAWYVLGTGETDEYLNLIPTRAKRFISNGCAFKTKESAEKAAAYYRKLHRLYKLAEELNEGWEPNWNNVHQNKYRINYNSLKQQWLCTPHQVKDSLSPVFKDKETAQRAIELIEAGALE